MTNVGAGSMTGQSRLRLAAIILLIATRLWLRLRGFSRTVKLMIKLSGVRRRAAPSGAEAKVLSIHTAVAEMALILPMRARCLEVSIVTAGLLRWYGHQAVVRLGVRTFPFVAHAWVEVGALELGRTKDAPGVKTVALQAWGSDADGHAA